MDNNKLKDLQTNLNMWYQKDQRFKTRSKLHKAFIMMLLAIFLVFYLISDWLYESVFDYEIIIGFVIYLIFVLPIWIFYLSFLQMRIKKRYNCFFDQLFNQIKKYPDIYTLYQEQFKITSVSNTGRTSITLALLSLDI